MAAGAFSMSQFGGAALGGLGGAWFVARRPDDLFLLMAALGGLILIMAWLLPDLRAGSRRRPPAAGSTPSSTRPDRGSRRHSRGRSRARAAESRGAAPARADIPARLAGPLALAIAVIALVLRYRRRSAHRRGSTRSTSSG